MLSGGGGNLTFAGAELSISNKSAYQFVSGGELKSDLPRALDNRVILAAPKLKEPMSLEELRAKLARGDVSSDEDDVQGQLVVPSTQPVVDFSTDNIWDDEDFDLDEMLGKVDSITKEQLS